MIRQLRKRHLQVWTAMAVLIPAGIIIAWLAIPKWPVEGLLQPASVTPLPVILKKANNTNYSVAIRTNADGSALQLEWINKTVLQYPSATIYAGGSIDDASRQLIGRIEARGNWYFPLDSSFRENPTAAQRFILYDFIHQQVIDTINCIP